MPSARSRGTPSASAAPQTATGDATAAPSQFPEKLETLRNADAELHLTNRGGAIKEIVLLNYSAEGGQRVDRQSLQRADVDDTASLGFIR